VNLQAILWPRALPAPAFDITASPSAAAADER
jgi:hypothetical protein